MSKKKLCFEVLVPKNIIKLTEADITNFNKRFVILESIKTVEISTNINKTIKKLLYFTLKLFFGRKKIIEPKQNCHILLGNIKKFILS